MSQGRVTNCDPFMSPFSGCRERGHGSRMNTACRLRGHREWGRT